MKTISYCIYYTMRDGRVQVEDIDIPAAFDVTHKIVDGWPVVSFKVRIDGEIRQYPAGREAP